MEMVVQPGGGETIADRASRTVAILAGVDAIAVTWTRYEPGERGPEPHIHRRHTDAFYVLDGAIVYGLGPEVEEIEARAGTFVAAPPGVVHTFRNDGSETARYLNFHAPSERFHDELRARRDGTEFRWDDQLDPPADGGRPLADAVVSGPGEGELVAVGGSSVLLKGTSDGTDGFLFLSETTLAPGFPGPPPHVHRELHDMFYVLEGTLSLHVEGETVAAPPGAFACFPPGVVHAFSNERGDETVRFLNVNTPAGWERYMRDLGAAFAGDEPPAPEEIGRIASRYDFELARGS